jgi:hypothetical protein
MGRVQARLGAACILLGVLGSIRPAPAAERCEATAPETPAGSATCQYAASTDGGYVAAVVGQWEILRKRGVVTTRVAVGDQPGMGAFQAQPGDVIVVRILAGSGVLSAGDR